MEISKKELRAYRLKQGMLAHHRDNGWCVRCYFGSDRYRPKSDIHHVYGRSSVYDNWRERYTSLMSLCYFCHYKLRPIRVKGAKKHKEVEELLRKANETPINPHFKHPPKQHD